MKDQFTHQGLYVSPCGRLCFGVVHMGRPVRGIYNVSPAAVLRKTSEHA